MIKQAARKKYPVRPDCGSTAFSVKGFIGYRMPYDAIKDDYGRSRLVSEEDFAIGATCASCEADVTTLFKERGLSTFYAVRWTER